MEVITPCVAISVKPIFSNKKVFSLFLHCNTVVGGGPGDGEVLIEGLTSLERPEHHVPDGKVLPLVKRTFARPSSWPVFRQKVVCKSYHNQTFEITRPMGRQANMRLLLDYSLGKDKN